MAAGQPSDGDQMWVCSIIHPAKVKNVRRELSDLSQAIARKRFSKNERGPISHV